MTLYFKPKGKYKPSLYLLMILLIVLGVSFSVLGIIFTSQQKRAKEIKVQEEHELLLSRVGDEVEQILENNIKKAFDRLLHSSWAPGNRNVHSLLTELKEIIKDVPVIKYPFIITKSGRYAYPFSNEGVSNKKGLKNQDDRILNPFKSNDLKRASLYKMAQNLEFRERKFSEAIKYYLKSIDKINNQEISPHVFFAISRCYYQQQKYPQAIAYLEDIGSKSLKESQSNRRFFFQVLFSYARTYKQMGNVDSAISYYLQLYENILQYELSGDNNTFSFFKNEALDYLNQKIRQDNQDLKKFDTVMALDGLDNLSELDIALRWKYFDPELFGDVISVNENLEGLSDFERIQDFFLPTDDKTLFYNEVKKSQLWLSNHSENEEYITLQIKAPWPSIVYSESPPPP